MIADPPTERLLRHITRLANDIGSRPVGSAANHSAAGYIAAAFQRLGMMPDMLRFDAPAWRHLHTSVSVHGEGVTAAANPFSPACDINAPLIAAGTLTELSSQLMTGRVVLLYGALSSTPLTAKRGSVPLSEMQAKLHDLVERGKPAALLFTAPRRGDIAPMLIDADCDIPSATLTPESALILRQSVGSPVQVEIDAARTWSYGDHIIARQPGRGRQVIVVYGHYDTAYNTPGAWDNASGIATMLGTAERLLGRWMNVWVEYAAFSNGVYKGASAALNECYDRYLMQHPDMNSIIAAINVDRVGQMLGTGTYGLLATSAAFRGLVDGVAAAFPQLARVEPAHYIDDLYAMRGVPTLVLSSQGIESLRRTPFDTPEWVSGTGIDQAVAFVTRLIEVLDGKSPDWTRG